uniref:Neurotensin receptor 1 n=1 Tax=Paramormyrops kingsleyae TaxID=1676925 RepID=A0A3B3TGS5_9TELE|nr:neurotensin receptor type 1-like [Paramormyrops kingsleyae]
MDPNDSVSSAQSTFSSDFRNLSRQLQVSANRSQPNGTKPELESSLDVNTLLFSKVLVTVIYLVLFLVGCLGNSVTLYTLLKRRTWRNLQSTVHYHLASLAISDLFILLVSMPIELYNFIWVHHPWAFGDAVCKGYYFIRDGCSYATAFNIASLSTERYMAICHPFKAKSIMSRSRTKKLISGVWAASFLLATPMLLTMGQISIDGEKICTTVVSTVTAKTVLQVNALLSFAAPMVIISVLNTAIARQLQQMFQPNCRAYFIKGSEPEPGMAMETSRVRSLRHGVKVLRAVVLAFVVCWLPYHSRRLMYCYVTEWTEVMFDFYHYFYMVTNVLFYISSAINPVLYNLVSANYRKFFFSTLHCFCGDEKLQEQQDQQQVRPRFSNSISSNHTFSIKGA